MPLSGLVGGWRKIMCGALLSAVLSPVSSFAQSPPQLVDLKLLLAVDVSGSIDFWESDLQRDGYVTTQPYSPIELTQNGTKLAKAAKKRHEIVYNFLVAIGVSERAAAVDSEGIEHHVSPETLKAMQAFLED